MALLDHLRELRNRFLIAVGAIVLAAVPGWLLYEPIMRALAGPMKSAGGALNFPNMTAGFSVQMSVALLTALILSCPVWLYEIWAFIVPGLTRREKWTAVAFIATAVPLFLAGCYSAYRTLPQAVRILLGFTLEGEYNLMPAQDYLAFVSRFILAFGVAFLLPVFLVGLNVAHVLSASVMLRGWRVATIVIFVFAALMTPTPDPWTMCALALPMLGLYFVACAVAAVIDRVRAKNRPEWAELDDDQASAL